MSTAYDTTEPASQPEQPTEPVADSVAEIQARILSQLAELARQGVLSGTYIVVYAGDPGSAEHVQQVADALGAPVRTGGGDPGRPITWMDADWHAGDPVTGPVAITVSMAHSRAGGPSW